MALTNVDFGMKSKDAAAINIFLVMFYEVG